MKKLLLGAAVSAALFGSVANATTIKLDNGALKFTANNTPDLTVPTAVLAMAGSSALDEVIQRTMLDPSSASVCAANVNGVTGSTAVKFADAATGGSDQYAVYCTLNTNNPTVNTYVTSTGNTRLLLLKRSNGGSAMGVVPVTTGKPVEFLNLTASQTSCTTGVADAAKIFSSVTTCAYGPASGSNINTMMVPNFGAADVSLNIFTVPSYNLPAVLTVGSTVLAAPTTANLSAATVFPGTAQAFGIAVTTSLRNALQEAQFGHGSACIGDETAPCMPSLSSGQIAEIFAAYPVPTGSLSNLPAGAGHFGDWTEFKVTDASAKSGFNDLYNYSTDANKPLSSKLHICGRTVGSGTKATMGVRFTGAACNNTATESNILAVRYDYQGTDESTQTGTGTLGIYNSTPVVESSTRPTVHTQSGSGGVVECLDELNSGNVTNLASGKFAPGQYYGTSGLTSGTDAAATRWAIGYLSVATNANNSKGLRFIKVDGAEPTLQNIANGSYPLWTESTYFYTATSVKGVYGKTTTSLTNLSLINQLITSLTTPTVLAYVNSEVSQFTWGLSGDLAIPTTQMAANLNGNMSTTPVNVLSYAIYPGTGKSATDDCRNPLVYANTSSAVNGVTAVGTANTLQSILLK